MEGLIWLNFRFKILKQLIKNTIFDVKHKTPRAYFIHLEMPNTIMISSSSLLKCSVQGQNESPSKDETIEF